MNEWISVKDRLPEPDQLGVYVKTDCEDCPVIQAFYMRNKFGASCIIQCDKHYESDQKFHFLKTCTQDEVSSYFERVTHWMPLPEPPKD